MAANCCLAPTASVALAGDTAIEVMVFTTAAGVGTVICTDPLRPLDEAVSVADPAATPVANPAALTVATDGVLDVQFTVPVTSAVEPSLYFAIAANCCFVPTASVALAADTAIEVIVLDGFAEPVDFAGLGAADTVLPHPVLAIIMETSREKGTRENQ